MKIPLVKLKAILLYFCENTDSRFLGKVKLMKLFYFLDFIHVKKYGVPVTWDQYVNLEHGPIPTTIKNIVDSATDDVDNSILSDTISIERPAGTDMRRIKATRLLSVEERSLFSAQELDTLQKVCARFGGRNTKYIEDASHKEAPWAKTKLLQKIPYILAVDDADCSSKKEEIEIMQQIYR